MARSDARMEALETAVGKLEKRLDATNKKVDAIASGLGAQMTDFQTMLRQLLRNKGPIQDTTSSAAGGSIIQDQAPRYMLHGDIQSRKLAVPAKIKENGAVNSYNYSEEHMQEAPETVKVLEEMFPIQLNSSLRGIVNFVAKGQSAPPAPSQQIVNKPATPDWPQTPETPTQPSAASSNPIERPGIETFGETSALEDEVEVKLVNVRDVPMAISTSEIAEEFKTFGKLKPDDVAIRTREDIDVCYVFVEFGDISGLQAAIKAIDSDHPLPVWDVG